LLFAGPHQSFRNLLPRIVIYIVLVLFSSAPFLPAAHANAVPFVDIVSPVSITPGSVGVTITVRGTGFVSGSIVYWSGTALTTAFVNAKELTAAVPNSFVAAVGLGTITVVTPAPGGGTSNVSYIPVASTLSAVNFPSTANFTASVGSGPAGFVTGDFNGDGKIDLAVANSNAGTVSILLGNGNGTFTAQPTVNAGAGANWIVTGDFNEDGKLDLAVANSGSNTVSILLGNGDGTFTLHSSPATGVSPFAIAAGDFNADGHLDLAVTNASSNTVTILLGNGTGAFAAAASPAVGSRPQVLVVGDFNEDGKLDLAVANESSNSVSMLLGNGDGTFQAQTSTAVGGSGFPIGLISGDFNNDTHLDVAAVNAADVAILLGNGAGGLTLHSNPTAGSNLISGVTGDFNGDGKLDIAVADETLGEAFLFLGNDDGTFLAPTTYTTASGTYSAVTADFVGNGALDLAFTNNGAGSVSIFLQTLPVSLSPASLSFGNQAVGVPSSPLTVTLTNSTGGTLTISAISITGTNSGDFSKTTTCGATVAVGATCTISVTFTPSIVGSEVATLSVTDNGNNSPQTLALSGTGTLSPPAIAKAFGISTIPLNGATSLNFTVTNPNSSSTVTGIAFTDTLPSGLLVATPSNLSSTCSGTASAAAGASSASLSAGTLPSSASCVISMNITGTSAGVKNNSVQVTSTNAGTGNTSNASITVVAPPVIIKSFGAASIPLGGSTSLSFTVQNNNTATTLSGIAFSDTLPAGLVVSTPNGLAGTCGGGTITATQGTNAVTLSAASLAQSTSCTFSVNVTGISVGQQTNTTGAVTSTQGGTGGTATAGIVVVAPPSIAAAFNPAAISVNGATALTFTITNPATNTVALSGVAFTDTLPTGLLVATPNGLSNTCAGTITATAGSSNIQLAGGSIATPNTNCTITVNVTGTASGSYTNVTGSVNANNGGTGNTASANLSVATPPTITKSFGAASIASGASTSLTFVITNPVANTVALTGVAFTDTLPSGLVVATPNALTGSCGGGTITATASSSVVSLAGATLAATASCTFSVNVTASTSGVKNNSVQVTSTNAGTGNTSNASITVVAPPVIIKSFGAASIPLGGSTSLSFTVQNTNTATTLSGIAFSDTLPAGLVVSTPNGLTGTCGGGTITATQGTNAATLSAASLAQSTSCTFSVNVTGISAGQQTNTTGAVTSTQGGTGGSATAGIVVVAPPSIAAAFNPAAISVNGATALTFTITNPAANTVAETGVAFTDTLPTGLLVATPNGLSNTCAGTITATAGSTGIQLAGGSIATNTSCTLTVNVTSTASGNYTNVTGSVSATNGGTGNTASANLSVAAPPTITKSFGAASIAAGASTSLTFVITNPVANSVALTGVAFTDTLPSGLVVATPNALTGSCGGGTITATASSSVVSLAGATLAATASCTFSVNVTASTSGVKNNSVQVTSTNAGTGNTSTASITVNAVTVPPVLTKAFGAASIPQDGSTSLSFTVQNTNTATTLSGIAFSDTLPAGLVLSAPNGLTGTCGGGAITAMRTRFSSVVSLSAAALAQSSSCTFSVNVNGTVAGQQTNTTGAITSTEGGTGTTASASIVIVAPPAIAVAFNPTAVSPNANSVLTFTITNPPANTVALSGVAFTDALPNGLVVATPNGLAGSCGSGAITASAGSGAINLAGATIAAVASCTFSVNVTATAAGSFTDVTGAVTSANGGTGNTASATLSTAMPPSIAESFGAATLGLATSTSLTFTISNSNSALALAGVAFTDALPSGLVVSTPNALTGSCGTGVITATAGSQSVTLSAGAIAASATCTFSVNVTAAAAGNQTNTTGAITSTNAGTGNAASASINVLTPNLTIASTHSGNFYQGQTSATYTLTVANTGAGPTAGIVTVTDILPAGLTATSITGSGWNCTLATLTCTRSDALAPGASYPPITLALAVAANAPSSVSNSASVSGGGEPGPGSSSAGDATTITLPPDFTVAAAQIVLTVKAGQQANFALTVTPQNNVFANAITLTLTGLPGRATYVFNPSSLTPGTSPALSTLNIFTNAADPYLTHNLPTNRLPLYALFLPLAGLVLAAFHPRRRRATRRGVWLALVLAAGTLALFGCAGARNFQNFGTPAGTYALIVTGSSGALQHSTPVTLIVTQ
jgi:uncharacterized repeat protein (TIGR01451 family)